MYNAINLNYLSNSCIFSVTTGGNLAKKNGLTNNGIILGAVNAVVWLSVLPQRAFALTCASGTMQNHGLFCPDVSAPEAIGQAVTSVAPLMYTLCVVMITLGGVVMFASIGIPSRYEFGKKLITSGIVGALLYSGFWVILSLLGVQFT